MNPHLIPQQIALIFITAGKATMTFKSLKTGKHFTYRITKSKEVKGKDPVWFCSLLTGSDNQNDYTYFGFLRYINGMYVLIHGVNKTCITENAPGYIAFRYVLHHLVSKITVKDLELWHDGNCCKCGRTLTDPLSIELGIGPECRKRYKKEGIDIEKLVSEPI